VADLYKKTRTILFHFLTSGKEQKRKTPKIKTLQTASLKLLKQGKSSNPRNKMNVW